MLSQMRIQPAGRHGDMDRGVSVADAVLRIWADDHGQTQAKLVDCSGGSPLKGELGLNRHLPLPRCYHCKYDLSGQYRSWMESCPMRSVCPECGELTNWTRSQYPSVWDTSQGGSPMVWSCLIAIMFAMLVPLGFTVLLALMLL